MLWIALFFVSVLAQRPSNASLCDYYSIQLYGANTTQTQYRLVESVMSLAFTGGSAVPNVSNPNLTGIWHPGFFQSTPVDLGKWFNASIASTNLNGQPAAVNWLNGGGDTPLVNYLTGQADSVEVSNSSNEYQFLIHQYASFALTTSCSLQTPLPPTSGGQRNLAYVHKFMDLNYTEIGHFINQVSLSAVHFGFSQQDGDQISTQLNAKFNNRCSPPDSTGQLYSFCQDPSCPLAINPDCSAYELQNLGINGPISSLSSGAATSIPTSSQYVPSTVSTSPATTSVSAATSTTPTSTSSPSHSSGISTGGIVGITIGGAALTFAFVLALVFLLRKRRNGDQSAYQTSTSFSPSVAHTDPHSSYISNQRVQTWNGPSLEPYPEPPLAEMEHPGSPDYRRSEMASPEGGFYVQR